MGYFTNGVLFHCIHGLDDAVSFFHVLFFVFFWGGPCTLIDGWTPISDRVPTCCSCKVYKINSNQIIKCLNEIISEINLIICAFVHLKYTSLLNFKRKIWTLTGIRTRTSRSLSWRSTYHWAILVLLPAHLQTLRGPSSSPGSWSGSNFSLEIW